jgi:protein TonB
MRNSGTAMSVLPALLLRLKSPQNDHLRIALLISAAAHACALLWRPSQPPPVSPPGTAFEVVLVNASSQLPPLHPAMLAQADLNGGGDSQTGVPSSPLPRTSLASPDEIVLAALRKRQAELEEQQLQLYTQLLAADDQVRARSASPERMFETVDSGDDALNQESVVLNARISVLREQIERYNAQPRQHFVGPSAKASDQAAYLDAWRRKIEQIGTEHYPEQARGKVHGDLQITVYIRSSGELDRIDVDRPSPHAVLNLAARRIIQLAAPFAPFPPEMAQTTDVLAVTRTWHFTNDQLETATP